ncbi:MAG: hypothetical protein A2506_12380 [Elusimicrobia bacterium RIFOXYD12_FULL_66_9]|nr:MAG: hypothetical protein A2506_12380 [Elusimicrobia bacterium RIFOXYD12_FULL_66_9]
MLKMPRGIAWTAGALLAKETARLMRKHGFIARKTLRVEDSIDNSLVREAMERTGLEAEKR